MSVQRFFQVSIGVIFTAVVVLFLVSLYLYHEVDEDSRSSNDKKLEISGSSLVGYHEGRLSWRVSSDQIWAGRSKYIFQASSVETGQVYDRQGRLILDDIFAQKLKVNTKSKVVSAFGGVGVSWLRYEANGKMPKKDIDVVADNLRYYDYSRTAYLSGHVVFSKDDVQVRPKRDIRVDLDQNNAYILHGFELVSDSFLVLANKMTIDIDQEMASISGNIRLVRVPERALDPSLDLREQDLRGKGVSLSCEVITYEMADDADVLWLKGDIKLQQHDKKVQSRYGYYNENKNQFRVWGGVLFRSGTLDWIIDRSRKDSFHGKEVREALFKSLEVVCDRLNFDGDLKMLKGVGNIKITQDDKTITCHIFEFNDAKSKLDLYGNVSVVMTDGKSFKARALSLNLLDETFEAVEGAESEFVIE